MGEDVGGLRLHLQLVEPLERFCEMEAEGEARNDEVLGKAEFFSQLHQVASRPLGHGFKVLVLAGEKLATTQVGLRSGGSLVGFGAQTIFYDDYFFDIWERLISLAGAFLGSGEKQA